MFGYNDVAGFGTERRVNRSCRTLEKLLMLRGIEHCSKDPVTAADLGQPRPESYLDVNDLHSPCASSL
jgi:hypothetical protein